MCAVAVAVRLAGAEWFPTQPVAGQETKRQIYRSGLRNSFGGRQLSAEELELALAQLRLKTGFARMRFDEAGFLTIDDRSQMNFPQVDIQAAGGASRRNYNHPLTENRRKEQ